MSRTPILFVADDVATLARALQKQLADAADRPGRETLGHVDLLNLLARTAGFRNYQHMRASAVAAEALATAATTPEPPVDHVRVAKALALFDSENGLVRWPVKANLRDLALWALWAVLPTRQPLSDREISDRLKTLHRFGDHALLRRELVDGGWFSRTMDGREYRRIERRPPPEARALIRHLAQRDAARGVDA